MPKDLLTENERALLAKAAAWPECRHWTDLSCTALATVAAEQGIDFATALLYERLRWSERHGPFIRRIDELLSQPSLDGSKLDVLVAVAPGAYHKELPDSGADGRLLRQRIADYGCRTQVIPVESIGTVRENGRIICDWLAGRSEERILLASLSKGAADIKAALAQPDAASAFRSVVAWLNLSGTPNGTPLANCLQGTATRLLFKALGWWKGLDLALTRQLEWGRGSVLDFPLVLPPHLHLINVIGFPLQNHFTSLALRCFHRRIARWGPNDGLILLADTCALPGLVYPVWGADHNLRPAWDIHRLLAALACYLAETWSLCGSGAEKGDRSTVNRMSAAQ
jgi:hypothetical protein